MTKGSRMMGAGKFFYLQCFVPNMSIDGRKVLWPLTWAYGSIPWSGVSSKASTRTRVCQSGEPKPGCPALMNWDQGDSHFSRQAVSLVEI
jgi:hypothetical protein